MSWEQLLAIYKQAEEDRLQEMNEPPVACPNDGEPLLTDRDGILRCRFDGWRWRGMSTDT